MRRYDICFHPGWWNQNAGIDFSRPFWDDPELRIAADVKMRRVLWDKFGSFGLGAENPEPRPLLGSDQTACGFLFSEMLGCRVIYSAETSPEVICAKLEDDEAFALQVPNFDNNPVWQRVQKQIDWLMEHYGRVESYLNLMGVQNIALDLRGQDLFMDYYDEDSPAQHLLDVACETMIEASRRLMMYTDELSAGVTNIVEQVCPKAYVTSNCTVEMVSQDSYEENLLRYDQRLADEFPHFGIHHCGKTMEHVVKGYAKVSGLEFAEVGAFSDLRAVADALPENVLINARYSPLQLMKTDAGMLREELEEMTHIVPGERLSVSCVGIDKSVSDEKVRLFLTECSRLLD